MNYLRATDAEVGLLLNFGPTPQKRRIVFTNDRKKNHMNTLILENNTTEK